MLVEELEPHIRAVILSTPREQLGTITAREVRVQLLARVTDVDKGWVKENKSAINELIGSVFEHLVPPAENADADAVKAEEDGGAALASDDDGGDDGGPSTPPTARSGGSSSKSKKKKSKTKRELTDEEYARQLAAELNGHAARSSRSGKTPPARSAAAARKGASRALKKSKKSAERVDDSDASDDDRYAGSDANDSRKRAKPKKGKRASAGGGGGGGGAKGGFGKEYLLRWGRTLHFISANASHSPFRVLLVRISAPLSALLEVDRLSRPQVVKQLWVYIKGHELQNPSNKREILCDDRLRLVFNADKIDMFKMNKVLGSYVPLASRFT